MAIGKLFITNDNKKTDYAQYFSRIRQGYKNRKYFESLVKYGILPVALICLFVGAMFCYSDEKKCPPNVDGSNETYKIRGFIYQNNEKKITRETSCTYTKPELYCEGLDLANGMDNLQEEILSIEDEKIWLKLKNSKFKNDRLEEGWLQTQNAKIFKLILEGRTLKEIGPQSFNAINGLESITLRGTGIKYLQRSAFQGLKAIWEFNICENADLTQVESGLLLEFSLNTFQLQGMILEDDTRNSQFFENLTGGKDIITVSTLDYQTNLMKKFLKIYTEHFPKVQQIFASQTGIEEFEPSTFSSNQALTILHLEGNAIETLPRNVFSEIISRTNIYASQNPLNCDCNVKWLQDILKTTAVGDLNYLTCTTPPGFENQKLTDIELNCQSIPTSAPEHQICGNQSLKVLTRNPKFEVMEILDKNAINVTFVTNEPLCAMAFQGESSDVKCQPLKPSERSVVIENTKKDTNYLFCFLGEDDVVSGLLSFQDCLAYKTLPAYENQAWITHGNKTLTIIYILCGGVGIMALGALLAYCIVRKKPTLLRGSKRVEIVKSRDGQTVLVLPEDRETVNGLYETISGYVSIQEATRPLPPLPPRVITDDYLVPREKIPDLEFYGSQHSRCAKRFSH